MFADELYVCPAHRGDGAVKRHEHVFEWSEWNRIILTTRFKTCKVMGCWEYIEVPFDPVNAV